MPGFKDLAALPTSWALTMWDAAPILLSVEGATAVLILGTLTGRWRARAWHLTATNLFGGLAYLAIFRSELGITFLILGAASLAIPTRTRQEALAVSAPGTTASGLATRAWATIGAVAVSAGVAASIKILIGPFVDASNPAWLFIAVAGSLPPLGTLGTAAIPALAATSAADSVVVGRVWLISAAVRPMLWRAAAFQRLFRVQSRPIRRPDLD